MFINNIKDIKKFNIKDFLSKISNAEKSAFITTLVFGFITHMFMFVNVLPTWDSMYNFESNSIWIHMGRWFLNESMKLSSFFDLPWIIGILSLLFLSITSVLVVNILDIKKISSSITIAAIIATFPTVTSTFSYMFLADGYMLGIALATLAVFITKRYSKGYFLGGIVLCFSIGIYQVNLSFAVLLSLFIILMNLIHSNKIVLSDIKCSLKYVYMAIIGLVSYFITLKALTAIIGKGLGNYQGANEGFALNMDSILKILTDFKDSFKLITGGYRHSFFLIILVCLVCICLMMLYLIIYNKVYKDIPRLLLILIACLSIPFITGFAYFISDNTVYHMVMRMSWCLFFILGVLLFEKITYIKPINTLIDQITLGIPIIILWVIIWNFILVDNISYLNMYQRYEKEYALSIRILDRLESSKDYSLDTPVLFLGSPYTHNENNIYNNYIANMTGTKGNSILHSDFHFKEFMKHYMGVELITPDAEKTNQITNSNDIKNLDSFPSNECISVIDGVLVIKLGTDI